MEAENWGVIAFALGVPLLSGLPFLLGAWLCDRRHRKQQFDGQEAP